jgi:nicotinate-nucleotide adenylyltransferase
MRPKQLGVLGGTFDPPHIAHLIIAQTILEKLKLDEIRFIPSNIPPHKKNDKITPVRHRLQMLKLAVSGHPRFKVSDLEVRRKGISYTIDTLRELSLPKWKTKLYLILGSDSLEQLSGWKNPKEIYRLAQVVLVRRPGSKLSSLNRRAKKIVVVEAPLLEVSSSKIRQMIKSGRSIKWWVPEEVRKYIEKHELYRR